MRGRKIQGGWVGRRSKVLCGIETEQCPKSCVAYRWPRCSKETKWCPWQGSVLPPTHPHKFNQDMPPQLQCSYWTLSNSTTLPHFYFDLIWWYAYMSCRVNTGDSKSALKIFQSGLESILYHFHKGMYSITYLHLFMTTVVMDLFFGIDPSSPSLWVPAVVLHLSSFAFPVVSGGSSVLMPFMPQFQFTSSFKLIAAGLITLLM